MSPDELSFDAQGRVRWGRQAAGLLIQRTDNGKIFLVLRSQEVMDPGLWGIPGGKVEPGESPVEAAFRETEEELGPFPGVLVDDEKIMKSGAFTYYTYIAYMPGKDARAWSPNLNWESELWKWVNPKRLPKNIHPGIAAILR